MSLAMQTLNKSVIVPSGHLVDSRNAIASSVGIKNLRCTPKVGQSLMINNCFSICNLWDPVRKQSKIYCRHRYKAVGELG